jgi:hydroxymethylpyrimidine pyrophosphatase-like HAD family hydrolase/energy-coupling factor transporter ATP-binding protein EcfA2
VRTRFARTRFVARDQPTDSADGAPPKPALHRYQALCCDFDGTIAHDSTVSQAMVQALQRVVAGGRHLVLATGRELDDLRSVFPEVNLFHRVVAENGALLYTPETGEQRVLCGPPSEMLVNELRRRHVQPLSVGRAIVATWEPHDATVLAVLRELGLELNVVFNKGAVMVLPSGVNKASGVNAALRSLGLSHHNAIGVGDAENDHALLARCQVAVAVANALPALKEQADLVTQGARDDGVRELIDELLADDLASRTRISVRHEITVGRTDGGTSVTLNPHDASLLVTGRSGSGKSTAAKALIEQLAEQEYSFCIVDPEGDYLDAPHAVVVGTQKNPLSLDEVAQALSTGNNIVFNLLGVALDERPAFFASMVPLIEQRRLRTGAPHALVIDEAHHMLGKGLPATIQALGASLDRVIFVTVHPEVMCRPVLQRINGLVVVGSEAERVVQSFNEVTGRELRWPEDAQLEQGQALVWLAGGEPAMRRVALTRSRSDHRRHSRKYAEGELAVDRSFHFVGPEGKLKLRAQNLMVFLQIGDGVDDDTWLHHLRQHDYSKWIEREIKDPELAVAVRQVEDTIGDAGDSRRAIRAAVERVYTLAG